MTRRDIEFRTGDGVALRGWRYIPDSGTAPFPTIVATHGFSAVKEMYLDRVAERFAEAGFAVLVYDHRNFGSSDGEPRQEADPWLQVRDLRDAITYAQTLAKTDSGRVGLWGTSFSGGHVVVAAGLDWRVRCVVAQVPGLGGPRVPKGASALLDRLAEDRRDRMEGKPPAMVPVVAAQGPAALATPDAYEWFTRTGAERAPAWRNEVTLRSLELMMSYRPRLYMRDVAPAPLLMIVAARDSLIPVEGLREAFAEASEPKKLLELDCGHFDPYVERFEECASAATAWFREHLST